METLNEYLLKAYITFNGIWRNKFISENVSPYFLSINK